jgi:hypothetical protein
MGKDGVPEIPLDVAREPEDMRAPEITEEALEAGGRHDQGGVLPQGDIAPFNGKKCVEGVLRQPRDGQAAHVGDDQRSEADEQEPTVPVQVGSNPAELLENVMPPCPKRVPVL